jgi:membrane protein YdbS with pleckstrin-like domain
MGPRETWWTLRRVREALREQLTLGERILAWTVTFLPFALLLVVGVVVLDSGAHGAGHTLGLTALIAAAGIMAVLISPVLRARVRRREERAASRR